MKKIIFASALILCSMFLLGKEHELFQAEGVLPNIMFLIDRSGSMNWHVYDHNIDYSKFTKYITNAAGPGDFCRQSSQGAYTNKSYDYLNDRVIGSGGYSWECMAKGSGGSCPYPGQMLDENGEYFEKNYVFLAYNDHSSSYRPGFATDENGNWIPGDPMDDEIVWSASSGAYRHRSGVNYTIGWDISDPSSIPTDSEGYVKFNYDPLPLGGFRFPSHVYRCRTGQIPCRRVKKIELIAELKDTGYFWTGYSRESSSGATQPLFLSLGNWNNQIAMDNLYFYKSGTLLGPAWRTCTYWGVDENDDIIPDTASGNDGRPFERWVGGDSRSDSWYLAPEGVSDVSFALVTDPSTSANNNPRTNQFIAIDTGEKLSDNTPLRSCDLLMRGFIIDKWMVCKKDDFCPDEADWEEPEEGQPDKPLRAYLQKFCIGNGSLSGVSCNQCFVPQNYVATFRFRQEGVRRIKVHIKHFDLTDSMDVVMIYTQQGKDRLARMRFNTRQDAIRDAVTEVIQKSLRCRGACLYMPDLEQLKAAEAAGDPAGEITTTTISVHFFTRVVPFSRD